MPTGPSLLRSISHPRKSLEGRLLVSFFLLSFMVLGVVGAVAYQVTRGSLTDAVLDQLRAASALKSGELDRWIQGELNVLEVVSNLPGVQSAADSLSTSNAIERLRSISADVARDGSDLEEVFFLSARGGRVVASSAPDREGVFHATDLFFLKGRSAPFVQEVYPSPDNGQPRITLAVPMRGTSGEVGGVIAAHLNLEYLDQIVTAPFGLYETANAYLVTETNEFLTGERFGLPDFQRGVHSVGITAALAGETDADLYLDYRGTQVLGAYRWIPERRLALLVEVTQAEAFAPARVALTQILVLGLMTILLVLVGIRWVAHRVSRPIVAVARAAGSVAEGDFSVTAPVEGQDEVAELSSAFNAMTGRLRALYSDLQRQVQVTTRAVEALEESRSLLSAIVDNSAALISVTDQEGRVQLMNRAFLDLLGLSDMETIGQEMGSLIPESLYLECASARSRAFAEKGTVEREITWPLSDGGSRVFLCIWFPLTGEGESEPFGVGMIATDLTERKRAEEERRRLESQMRHAQKLESLGVLAGGIAHDFNNILAAILGHGTLAVESLEEYPSEVASHLDHVLAAAERAADLTNQMLAYAGRASFRVETLDLNQAIREMSSLMSVSLPKKVQLEMRLADEPLPVKADPAQLSQVVMNLITNGAQAMGDHAGTVEVSTVASLSGEGAPRAVLRVRDTGSGMDAATRERIFDPFFTTKEKGRGLGLAAVLGIVKGLHGSVEVESQPGQGTTFTVSFPVDREEASALPSPAEPAVSPADGARTLLVVDDEDAVRGFTVRVLEREGFGVLEAEDGLAALRVYARAASRIDGVVLDLSMPGMGGEEVFRKIRAQSPELPVLFTSGYDPSDIAASVTGEEGVGFLQKPYRPGSLLKEIQSLLEDGGGGEV